MPDTFRDLIYELGAITRDTTADTISFPVYIYVNPKPDDLPIVLLQSHVVDFADNKKKKDTEYDASVTAATTSPWYNYVATFTAVPVSGMNSEFTLHVHVKDKSGIVANAHLCRELCVNGGGYGGGGGGTVTIASPSTSNVPVTFTSYGYDSPQTNQVTGWIVFGTPPNQTTIQGTTLASPSPPYNWAVSFTGLPTGSKTGTLTIQITGTTTQTSMTVISPISLKHKPPSRTRRRVEADSRRR